MAADGGLAYVPDRTAEDEGVLFEQALNNPTRKGGSLTVPALGFAVLAVVMLVKAYSCGPAATSALPASLSSYFAKFFTKRSARSFAFSSHSAGSA